MDVSLSFPLHSPIDFIFRLFSFSRQNRRAFNRLTALDEYMRHLKTQNGTNFFNEKLFVFPDEPVILVSLSFECIVDAFALRLL